MADRDQKILALRKQGMRAPQIAVEVGCSPATAVRVLRRYGVQGDPGRPTGKTGKEGKRSTEARRRKEEALLWRNRGHTIRSIADKIGVSERSVVNYLSDGGLKNRT